MKKLTFTRPHRAGKLQTELATIPALQPREEGGYFHAVYWFQHDGDTITLTVPDNTDEAAVQAVVDAHDPTTPGADEVAQERDATNERTLRERVDQAVAVLEQAYTAWPTLTAAERMDVARLNVRVTVALARLILRKLDST